MRLCQKYSPTNRWCRSRITRNTMSSSTNPTTRAIRAPVKSLRRIIRGVERICGRRRRNRRIVCRSRQWLLFTTRYRRWTKNPVSSQRRFQQGDQLSNLFRSTVPVNRPQLKEKQRILSARRESPIETLLSKAAFTNSKYHHRPQPRTKRAEMMR